MMRKATFWTFTLLAAAAALPLWLAMSTPAGAAGFDPRWATCSMFGHIRSLNSNIPVTVTFHNRTNSFRSVVWIGFDGVPKTYANLNPGQSFTINTYVTHPWMFTDGPGNCIEMFMPQPGIPVFNITAPNRPGGGD